MEDELAVEKKRFKQDSDNEDEELVEKDKNKFSNDGSFLEMFQSKMEEEKRQSKEDCGQNDAPSVQHSIKSIQAGVGRPKALQKSLELRQKRKRHREQIEEQKRIEESQQSEDGKAWKKYLAEMKAYEERLCIEKDGSRRPLVK